MADSGNQPPLCPCGFFGSMQTNGLCSKCFKEHQAKSSSAGSMGTESKPGITTTSLTKVLDVVKPEKNEDKQGSTSSPSTTQQSGASSVSEGSGSADAASASSQSKKASQDQEEAMDVSKEPSPSAKRDISEVVSEEGDDEPERPKQKNKKRCFICNCKLELAIREIGRCRCDYVFCQMHRLPEQHDCIYDHKERGRQDARDKMVSPKKHIGTSLKRIDSDS